MTTVLARTPGHATAEQRAFVFSDSNRSCVDKPKPALGSLQRRLDTVIARHSNPHGTKPRWDESDSWRPGEKVTFYRLGDLVATGVVWSFGSRNDLRLVIPEGERHAVCVRLSGKTNPVGYEARPYEEA